MSALSDSMVTRRQVLCSSGISTLILSAGCLSGDESEEDREGPAESSIDVSNQTEREHEVAFLVHDEDTDTRVVDETVTISADTRHEIPFSVDTGDDDIVEVRVAVELVDPPAGIDEEDQRDEQRRSLRVSTEPWFNGRIREERGIDLQVSTV